MEHYLSPTGVAVLFIAAVLVDSLRVGPNALSDRLAFFMALAAVHEGFNGSPLDQWTVGWVTSVIQKGLDMTDGAYVAAASANVVFSVMVACFAIYTVGVLLPVKASKNLGRFASLSWSRAESARFNKQLWFAAFVLGLFSDLPQGGIGEVLQWFVSFVCQIVAFIPSTVFGVV